MEAQAKAVAAHVPGATLAVSPSAARSPSRWAPTGTGVAVGAGTAPPPASSGERGGPRHHGGPAQSFTGTSCIN